MRAGNVVVGMPLAHDEISPRRYTELDLSSAFLDQPWRDLAPVRKLLILAPPRTGSYMLCRQMLHAGLGVPHEYFNDIHMYLIGRRSGIAGLDDPRRMRHDIALLGRYLRHLYRLRTRGDLFAAKIQYRHFTLFLRGAVGRELFEGASLVYLTREDIVAQAVSLHLAEVSGRWSFEPARLTLPKGDAGADDMAAIAGRITRLRDEEAKWERLFALLGQPPLRITYEALCKDPWAIIGRIAALCGAAPEQLSAGYDDRGRYPVDGGFPDKDALAARFRLAHPELVAGRRATTMAAAS